MPGLKWPTPNLMRHGARRAAVFTSFRRSSRVKRPFVRHRAAKEPFHLRTLQECKSPTERPMRVSPFEHLKSRADGTFRADVAPIGPFRVGPFATRAPMKPSSPDTSQRTNTQEGECVDLGDTSAASCAPNSRITASPQSTHKPQRRRLALACPDGSIRQLLAPLFDSIATVELREVGDGTQLNTLLVDEGPFDLVISHAAFPGSRGLEVLTKARGRGDETPFILVQSLHQNFVRITIGGGQHSIVSTRLVNVVGLVDLVRQILFERPAKPR